MDVKCIGLSHVLLNTALNMSEIEPNPPGATIPVIIALHWNSAEYGKYGHNVNERGNCYFNVPAYMTPPLERAAIQVMVNIWSLIRKHRERLAIDVKNQLNLFVWQLAIEREVCYRLNDFLNIRE
ncbi:unnamed protein product [Oppiella nova]|uniref:Uncharacterized protein n=1 Tax=Oppiella nova TaxID=334625 RepID=A0A7R9M6X1_9ACAR|nr:unnamed protein product [Oppiella nova]CAG2171606.1 unnamed protein product [Oppiella nova]